METISTESAAAHSASQSIPRTLGAEDWHYLYMATGFALVLEGIFVQMILGDRPPANLLVWFILAALTLCLAIYNRGTRDALLRAKERFEAEHGPGHG